MPENKNIILSVDDSVMIRKIIGGTIRSLGYEFLEAENGLKGLEVLSEQANNIVLILLDWNMPLMNGYEFLEVVKKNSKYSSIPIMMLTTESEGSNVIKAIQAGAINYLTKPFTPEDLSVKIMECLGMDF